jgi:benzil reductase ((S)-benzoin forming)
MALIVLTGHSRGLGAALARRLLRDDHSVLGVARRMLDGIETSPHNRLRQLTANLASREGLLALSRGRDLQEFFRDAEQAVLIHNAGLVTPIGPADQLNDAEVADAVMVNLTAAMILSTAFLRITHHCPDRRILLVSSGAARSPYAGWSAYCAGKAGLDHFARTLALEGHANLRIESLAPGVIDTDMQTTVRSVPLALFPMRPRFEELKASGGLTPPDAAAEVIAKHLFSSTFGKEICSDIRQLR